jgi:hypothetical protein
MKARGEDTKLNRDQIGKLHDGGLAAIRKQEGGYPAEQACAIACLVTFAAEIAAQLSDLNENLRIIQMDPAERKLREAVIRG